MIEPLAPCPECGHKVLHQRTTKTTVSMPVSIRCGLCDLTIEMQIWSSLVKFWNGLPRQSNTRQERSGFNEKDLTSFIIEYAKDAPMPIKEYEKMPTVDEILEFVKSHQIRLAKAICAKFAVPNEGLSEEELYNVMVKKRAEWLPNSGHVSHYIMREFAKAILSALENKR